eukprot:5387017-Pyramimonas_sp.AAC.1
MRWRLSGTAQEAPPGGSSAGPRGPRGPSKVEVCADLSPSRRNHGGHTKDSAPVRPAGRPYEGLG